MKTVIVLSGKKSTGKDTSAKIISKFFECQKCRGSGVLVGHMHTFTGGQEMCKLCGGAGSGKTISILSYADPLKQLCRSTFGLSRLQCYGESGERETPSTIKWSDLSVPFHELRGSKSIHSYVSAREILQLVGTNVMRSFYPNVWANAAGVTALNKPEDIVIFSDARFPNEIEVFESLKAQGKLNLIVIRLLRDTEHDDRHESENALNEWDDSNRFSNVIKNNGSLDQLGEKLRAVLRKEGIDV